MIIDVHAHLGEDFVFDEVQDEEMLLNVYAESGIDKVVLQPFICRPYIEDTRAAHDRVAALCKKQGSTAFYGMASINPHFRPDDYKREAERCIKELGFVAIKIATSAHGIHPSSRDGMHVFETARALGVPIMIHTGLGLPFADPAAAWRAIEAFPDVKTVLAHTGSNICQEQAVMLAKRYNNVYLEPSWMPSVSIAAMVNAVGPQKVMFSSDLVGNVKPAIFAFRQAITDERHLDQVMWKTASSVFGI